MPTHMFAFATALVASVSLTPVARRVALHMKVIDRPGPRKLQRTPMPLLGGLAIYTAAVLAIIIFIDGNIRAQVVGILASATLLVIVGVLDDRGLLHHQIKLFVGIPLASLIVIASGVHATLFESLFVNPSLLHPISSAPLSFNSATLLLLADYSLTFLWVVGLTAAFSIFDHMDGLCAGIAAMASAFFLLFAFLGGQILVGTLAAALLGAALGFLCWNFKPAKIFMGDSGAMFLGFMMATLGLKLRFPGLPESISWMIPVLILGVPIFDTTLVTFSRIRRGLVPFTSPGKDHSAHRLANLGLGQRGAVLSLYSLGILFGFLALLLRYLAVWQGYALGATILVGAVLAIVGLEHAPYERQGTRRP